ncbi:MAG: DUF3300 domain-containing protein [bacterium]|nr:DUF3300 domain-containing protein [bacterium]
MQKLMLIFLSVLILNTFGFSEDPGEDSFQAKYYDNAKVLRVKYTQGETYVKRSYDDGLEEASVNLPVFEKDRVGTTEGRVEIYLGRLNYLRLDYDTEVQFERVPELRKTNAAVRIQKGGVYLDVENLDFERDIEIQTPDCGIFLLDKGVYRINVTERGRMEICVYEGMAEVSGEQFNRNVRESQKIVMSNGDVLERPFYFYASDTDGFDRWHQERNSSVGYARYSTSRYLSKGYEDYEYELSRNGRWEYSNTMSEYVWMPYNVGMSWSPYSHGRWIWTPFYGYVWSSYDSWGYFTHHYGRWHWDTYSGWYWYPGYHWSPAWVYWFGDRHHYGWCPLSRWNRPLIIINNRWARNHHHRKGIPIHSRGTVIIKKKHLGASHIRKVAIGKTALAKRTIMGKGFAPRVKPGSERIKVVNARGKTVQYKKGGFLAKNRYRRIETTGTRSGTSGIADQAKGNIYKYRGTNSKSSPKRIYKYSKTGKTGISKTSAPSKSYSSYIKKKAGSKRSTPKSTSKYKPYKAPKKYRSSSGSKSKPRKSSSTSKRSSSSSKPAKVKKKKSPSYYSSSSGYSGGSSSGTYKTYKSSTVKKKRYTPSYKSYSKSSSNSTRSSYRSPSRSSRSSSYKSYSSPKRSSRSSSRSSRSYKSPSRSSSRSSSRSASRSSRSSSRSSSSRSSSRSSSSRSSSSKSSSSRSAKRK